jgi:hypothetical protein
MALFIIFSVGGSNRPIFDRIIEREAQLFVISEFDDAINCVYLDNLLQKCLI